jgi:hypothetical protein
MMMLNAKSDLPVKIGLLFVALAWFSFTFYEFVNGLFHGGYASQFFWILLTDTVGCVGLGFRTVAGFIAVITILLYVFKRGLSRPEAIMSLRLVVLLEAAYWLSLFPSGVWGVIYFTDAASAAFLGMGFLIDTGLPCIVESIVMPIVLVKLFFELSPNKPVGGAVKWGLLSGTFYLFVSWLNNTSVWTAALMEKGIEYISLYPINLFSFAMTAVGLLLLTAYAAYFSKKSFGEESFEKLDLRKIGLTVTAFGLYFDLNYVLWLFFGSVGGWGTWYAWILGHNMDLWILSAPLLGLPLLFRRKR